MNEKEAIEGLRKIYIEINDCSKYPSFGAAYDALEKQIVKRPHTSGSYCPTCGTIVIGTEHPLAKYCIFCGQKLRD